MAAETAGQLTLRKEFIDPLVKGFALKEYKLKPLCLIETSNAWQESFYKETAAELVGGTEEAVRGVPRLAAFPTGEVSWTKTMAYNEKFGMEASISWEDIHLNAISVITRTTLRIARAVTNAVDILIEAAIADNAGNNLVISNGYEWDSATIANRDPVKDILTAIQTIRADNYDPLTNGYLVVNGTDYTNIISNTKCVNSPTFKSADVVTNGRVGQICGLTIVVTESVTVSGAYVVIGKEAMTWKEAKPLNTIVIDDPGIKTTIRAFEVGCVQITNPDAICKIRNTRA